MSEHVLNRQHDTQLSEYLKMLRRKRDAAIAEVAADFNDLRENRLFNDSYDVEEVLNLSLIHI